MVRVYPKGKCPRCSGLLIRAFKHPSKKLDEEKANAKLGVFCTGCGYFRRLPSVKIQKPEKDYEKVMEIGEQVDFLSKHKREAERRMKNMMEETGLQPEDIFGKRPVGRPRKE